MIRLACMAMMVAAAWLSACGDDGDDAGEQRQEREGPEGCYIGSRMMCDCEIVEEDCTEDVGVWTPGCSSCEP